ncbi:isochorismatase [Devosia insulae DS-56]|uniref:Isochorismatase n=1 Tax=Devosia insulae DS-56 TaxID=1116389 RepID=A0A1E5XNU1_9HYPH|nr:isochorismatase family protein [Devosia insulae]OEO30272.1 isochorismatase [Devosia insulae DS-56]
MNQPSAQAPVIVVDLQTGMFDGKVAPPLLDADGIVARVRTILEWARVTGRKVAFIRQNSPVGDQLEPGAPGWHIWPALGQAADERTFDKTVTNAFSNPDLLSWVRAASAGDVIVVGAATGHCVAATVRGAAALGLAVTVVADAHSTGDRDGAAALIADHNRAFAAEGATVITTAELTGAAP